MLQSDILNIEGQKTAELSLSDEVFGVSVNIPLMHEVVLNYLANQRRGTASTKTRAEVSGSGRKPWKQKGTGRARAGSIRSPLWRHGGVIFAKKPRDYSYDVGKKKKNLAVKMALSSKFKSGEVMFLEKFEIEEPKTKKVFEILKKLNLPKKLLLVVDKIDKNLKLASRNIKGFRIIPAQDLNAYEILNSNKIIFTKDAIERLNV